MARGSPGAVQRPPGGPCGPIEETVFFLEKPYNKYTNFKICNMCQRHALRQGAGVLRDHRARRARVQRMALPHGGETTPMMVLRPYTTPCASPLRFSASGSV